MRLINGRNSLMSNILNSPIDITLLSSTTIYNICLKFQFLILIASTPLHVSFPLFFINLSSFDKNLIIYF